jgi:transcriptional regulator of acetoin/glycerol metabolism
MCYILVKQPGTDSRVFCRKIWYFSAEASCFEFIEHRFNAHVNAKRSLKAVETMNSFPLDSKVVMNRARSEFFSQGAVSSVPVSETILRSWRRSKEHGLDADRPSRDIPVLTERELRPLEEKNRILLTRSRPVMENLYEQIASSSSLVMLADTTGIILHSLGDTDFIDRARTVSLQPGGVWSEQLRGTNAIGTALVEQNAVLVRSSEHFTADNHFLACAASPIFDPHGALLGVLDVSGDSRANQQHTMALVRISAQQIENQMFADGFESEITLHFHNRPEFLGSLYEAVIVFSRDGRFRAANRSALLHLGIDRYQARTREFATLFDMSFDHLISQACLATKPVLTLLTRAGAIVFARVKGIHPGSTLRGTVVSGRERGLNPVSEREIPTLETLEFGDPKMQKAIAKARRIMGHDISILIEGESGTGKELFAKALHYSGPRKQGPFIALNCAAIPEGLIESELFGYQEGAFTGARKKGSVGKIREANGGTLFLDEIGDMPLALQARLLRVLQERVVTPLGGAGNFLVDIAIICATNRKLRAETAAGRFREDLYYRLNGLLLSLPRLSEREDLLTLARNMVAQLAGPGRIVHMSPEVTALFRDHPWPGNIRQMHNVLRTALALLGNEVEITPDHLPEDFLEQHEEAVKARTIAPADHSSPSSPLRQGRLDDLESIAIRTALEKSGGNVAAAARQLGVSRNTVYRKTRESV